MTLEEAKWLFYMITPLLSHRGKCACWRCKASKILEDEIRNIETDCGEPKQ